jgi:hypothetical protein
MNITDAWAHDGQLTSYCCSMHDRSYSEYKFSQVDEVEFASRWGGIGKGDGATENEMIRMNICGSAMIRWNGGLNFGGTFPSVRWFLHPFFCGQQHYVVTAYFCGLEITTLCAWRFKHVTVSALSSLMCHMQYCRGPALELGSFGACSVDFATSRSCTVRVPQFTTAHRIESSCI